MCMASFTTPPCSVDDFLGLILMKLCLLLRLCNIIIHLYLTECLLLNVCLIPPLYTATLFLFLAPTLCHLY